MSNPIRYTNASGMVVAVMFVAASLTACGGGNSAEPDVAAAATDTVPLSAAASTRSFISFQEGLAPSNTDVPLGMEGFLPPTDDTAEPIPIG